MRSAGETCGDRGPKLAATEVTATIGSEWRKWSSQEDVDTMERLRCPEDDEEVVTEPAQTTKKTELVRRKKKNSCHRIGKIERQHSTVESSNEQRYTTVVAEKIRKYLNRTRIPTFGEDALT